MKRLNIRLDCCMCEAKHYSETAVNGDWVSEDEIVVEGCFCPEHAKVAEFKRDHCSGCVSAWMDPACPLAKCFALSTSKGLTPRQKELVLKGHCPVRINGTLSIDNGAIKHLSLDDQSTTETGIAVLDAIETYMKTYKTGPYNPNNR